MINYQDATAMADAVRHKEVTPLELVQTAISKAKELNPQLNAIVSTRYEEALEEAKHRDFLACHLGVFPFLLRI